MAGYCALLAFAGFSQTYFIPIAQGQLEDLSPVVHIHGFLFFCWMILFVVQSSLIRVGQKALHRNLGMAAISLATAMVIFGLTVNLLANERRIEIGNLDQAYSLGLGSWMAIIAFATMFSAAIANTRKPERHKRLMLFATAMLLQPAVGRIFRPFISEWGSFLGVPTVFWVAWCTVNAILVACLVYDYRTAGRFHPVTLVCGAVLIARELLPGALSGTTAWRAIYDSLLLLVA